MHCSGSWQGRVTLGLAVEGSVNGPLALWGQTHGEAEHPCNGHCILGYAFIGSSLALSEAACGDPYSITRRLAWSPGLSFISRWILPRHHGSNILHVGKAGIVDGFQLRQELEQWMGSGTPEHSCPRHLCGCMWYPGALFSKQGLLDEKTTITTKTNKQTKTFPPLFWGRHGPVKFWDTLRLRFSSAYIKTTIYSLSMTWKGFISGQIVHIQLSEPCS